MATESQLDGTRLLARRVDAARTSQGASVEPQVERASVARRTQVSPVRGRQLVAVRGHTRSVPKRSMTFPRGFAGRAAPWCNPTRSARRRVPRRTPAMWVVSGLLCARVGALQVGCSALGATSCVSGTEHPGEGREAGLRNEAWTEVEAVVEALASLGNRNP
jgi:hypothetical protein